MAYLSVDAIGSVIALLDHRYATCRRFTLPEQSREGRTIKGLRVRSTPLCDRPGLLLLGGTHARELVNPDLLLRFVSRLLRAHESQQGIEFGPVFRSPEEVRRVLDGLDLFVVPLVNPDGRAYVQDPNGDPWWRKNRAPNDGACAGVDLNRNCDFLWDSGIASSGDACAEMFRGPNAFSEPETRNVRRLLDRHPHISLVCDVHSYYEVVMHNWADDDVQTNDPGQSFRNPGYDGDRGVADSGYREFIRSDDLAEQRQLARAVARAIEDVRGHRYRFGAWADMLWYTAAGTFQDYAYSRHMIDTRRGPVFGMTIETATEFQPPREEAERVIEEVSAGLFELCLARAETPVCVPGWDDWWSWLTGSYDEDDADHADFLGAFENALAAQARRVAADDALADRWRAKGRELAELAVAGDRAADDLAGVAVAWLREHGADTEDLEPWLRAT